MERYEPAKWKKNWIRSRRRRYHSDQNFTVICPPTLLRPLIAPINFLFEHLLPCVLFVRFDAVSPRRVSERLVWKACWIFTTPMAARNKSHVDLPSFFLRASTKCSRKFFPASENVSLLSGEQRCVSNGSPRAIFPPGLWFNAQSLFACKIQSTEHGEFSISVRACVSVHVAKRIASSGR